MKRPMAVDESLLTVKEAAHLLNVHPNSIRRWANAGLLKSHRFGVRGDRRFRREDLAEFLDSWAGLKAMVDSST